MAWGIHIVIQARSGSTRLRNKVLLPLGETCALVEMVKRVRRSRLADRVVVATTRLREDDPVVEICDRNGIACFRGHDTDLLDRHYEVMQRTGAEAIVKVPSDCPLIDATVIDKVIGFYLDHADHYDYVSNLHPQSYPDGNDVEVIRSSALAKAWREARQTFEREHTTPFLWDNPHLFRIGNVFSDVDEDFSLRYRWTLDYYEDYLLIKSVFDALAPVNPEFGVDEIVRFLDAHPEIKGLNEKFLGEFWYTRAQYPLRTRMLHG